MTDNHPLLRALRLNALFSAFSSASLFLAAGWIAGQLGLPGPLPVYLTGGMLMLFSLHLFNIVRTRRVRDAEIIGIIAGDLLWVAASAVMVALYYSKMTAAGLLLVDVVAIAVAVFAVLQIRGLRAYRRRPPA